MGIFGLLNHRVGPTYDELARNSSPHDHSRSLRPDFGEHERSQNSLYEQCLAGHLFLFFFQDSWIFQSPEPDVHLFSAARPSSFGEDVVSCEAGWHGFRKVGCSGSSNSGAYPNLPRDILCLTYGMAEAPSHCPSPHQRIHLSRAYTKARSPTIQK